MKKIVSIIALAAIVLTSGCSTIEKSSTIKNNTAKATGPFVCKDGSKYSTVHDKCLVMNFELNGVVESKDCNDSKCSAIILDERSRRIKIEADDNINIGDQVSIVLYKKGEKIIKKEELVK